MNSTANAKEAEIKRFETYIKQDPKNALLWTNLGDLYHQSGRWEEAIACYEKCLMFDEGNMIARSRLSNVLISQHRFDEAEQIIQGIMAQTGEDSALLHNLGLTLFYQRKFDEAQAAFQKAREMGIHTPNNLAYMVYALHKKNDTAQALELAQTWLQESPGEKTEGYISMLEMDHGDMDAAKIRAQHLLQQHPENPDANVVMGTWHMEQQQVSQAVTHFQQVVQSEPNNPRGWQGLGLAYMHQQDFPKAIEALNKANDAMAGYPTNHLIIGWAKLANQDAVGAEQAFRKAIEIDHNFGEAHGGLASALVFQNRLDEARGEIKKAMGLSPKGFGAVYAQSISMQLRGKGEQGTKMLAKLLEQKPLPRSKPMIEYIQDYLKSQGHASTPRDLDKK
ncbi:tetratricopeptide repeat protein [Marinobacterium sp. D7]|uniref:tetratricopeptide repeat protein n=1 Tax=Marinobacterium ramblicola TaxID=2849041 RepID=UPI001C2D5EEF|nr:tetratricopeptide repeat protein [Marinobacterium ramblicola]MBV1787741.1 tetratricopeptide repeat protein [Marinobacterium ramblicola]